jgi:hypothetical protein
MQRRVAVAYLMAQYQLQGLLILKHTKAGGCGMCRSNGCGHMLAGQSALGSSPLFMHEMLHSPDFVSNFIIQLIKMGTSIFVVKQTER